MISATQRRLAILVLMVVSLGALVMVNRDHPGRVDAEFTQLGQVRPPFAPTGEQLTGSWFCPGVPRTGNGTGGRLAISNPNAEPLTGTVTVFSNDRTAQPARTTIDVPQLDTLSVDLAALQPAGTFLSALVELTGGQGLVEQRAIHPAGDSVWPCSNAAAGQWYFADGFTSGSSTERLVITNPFATEAIVNIQLVTGAGTRNPSQLQGMPIPGETITTIDLHDIAKNESMVAVKVVAARGRVVAARAQNFTGGGRLGYSVTLGSASLFDQFYFPREQVDADSVSRYTIYNPNPDALEITVVPVTSEQLDVKTLPAPITVEAGEARTVVLSSADTSELTGMPTGAFGLVFAASTGTPGPFLVERAITRTVNGSPSTSVTPGVPGQTVNTRWSMVIAPQLSTSQAINVLNVDNQPGVVKVWALSDEGFVAVPGLEALDIAATSTLGIDLEGLPEGLRGRPLMIDCTTRMVVERSLQRGHDLPGRSLSVPLNG